MQTAEGRAGKSWKKWNPVYYCDAIKRHHVEVIGAARVTHLRAIEPIAAGYVIFVDDNFASLQTQKSPPGCHRRTVATRGAYDLMFYIICFFNILNMSG